MADTTITSANSIFTLVVASLFPIPFQLEGYSTDSAVVTDAIDLAEIQMGVDGRMTAGYVPSPTSQTIDFQADSPSLTYFDAIIAATKTAKDVYYISGSLVLPSTGKSYTLTRGILQNVKQIPDLKKVLDPVGMKIVWQSVNPAIV